MFKEIFGWVCVAILAAAFVLCMQALYSGELRGRRFDRFCVVFTAYISGIGAGIGAFLLVLTMP